MERIFLNNEKYSILVKIYQLSTYDTKHSKFTLYNKVFIFLNIGKNPFSDIKIILDGYNGEKYANLFKVEGNVSTSIR